MRSGARAGSRRRRSRMWPSGPATSGNSGTKATNDSTSISHSSTQANGVTMPSASKHVSTFTTPADTDVVVTRTFDAPRKLVFEAHTSCKHMPNGMGPYGWTMSESKNYLRPGGEFRYTWSKPGGGGITITGVNKEITPPSRIVSTESWGEPWPVSTNTRACTEV